MSILRHTTSDEPHFLLRTLGTTLPRGSEIRAHSHAWPQLIYAIRGVMTVWTDQGSWVVPPTWAIWTPAGVRHSIRASGETEMRMLYLRPGTPGAPVTGPTVIHVSALLRELAIRAVDIGMLDERDAVHRAIVTLIANSLNTHATEAFDLPIPAVEPLRTLSLELLSVPSSRARSLAELATTVAMSTRTFERSFLAATGMSFGRWRRNATLADALRMLAAGTPVKLVAARAGFHSPSAFVFAFRQMFGQTPGQYFAAPPAGS